MDALYGHLLLRKNLDRMQRMKKSYARIIHKSCDYVNTGGINHVESLEMQIIRQRTKLFLSILMFKSIHDLAPHHLCKYEMEWRTRWSKMI